MTTKQRYTWTKNFTNGDKYDGEAIGENVKDGKGTYVWAASGATYSGNWSNDLPHGSGIMKVPGNDGYEYEGQLYKGQRNGTGTCRFNNGRVYIGEWRGDEMEGQGTLNGAPGADNFTDYTGPFHAGMRSGARGKCAYSNGDLYEGSWVKGKRQGQGELRLSSSGIAPSVPTSALGTVHNSPHSISSTGSTRNNAGCQYPATGCSSSSPPVLYKGAFHNDVPCTEGGDPPAEITYADGGFYKGGVSALMREGEGEFRAGGSGGSSSTSDVYTGFFRRDLRDGRGVLRCADGSVFEGTWTKGQLDGQVTYSAPDTSAAIISSSSPSESIIVSYTGPCLRGEFTGVNARATFADGSVYYGEVRAGRPTGRGVLENRRLVTSSSSPASVSSTAPLLPVDAFGPEVVLTRYEGKFFDGRPEGDGTATVQVPSSLMHALGKGNSITGDISSGGKGDASSFPARSESVVELTPSYQRNGEYTGTWSQGLPHGRGTWRWTSGDAYTGEVVTGLAHGFGTYTGTTESYEGNFACGLPNGRGTYTFKDGKSGVRCRYEGEFQTGLASGDGVLTQTGRMDDGSTSTYTGGWQAGMKEGRGVEKIGDETYEGDYRRGLRHGRGTLRKGSVGSSARTTYDGEFEDGEQSGKGVLTLADGTVVEGSFLRGKPHGKAVVVRFSQGIVFTGTYDNGCVVDEGEIVYPNGDKFVGQVERADGDNSSSDGSAHIDASTLAPQRHGKGVFTFVEGNRLECTWRHNVLHGEGKYTVAGTSETSIRHYVDGVISTKATTSDSIFTPENEFPNTQSADALREKMQNIAKPFKFVRKGESKTTAAGAAAGTSGASRAIRTRSPSDVSTGTGAAAAAAAEGRSSQQQPARRTSSITPRGLQTAPPAATLPTPGEGRKRVSINGGSAATPPTDSPRSQRGATDSPSSVSQQPSHNAAGGDSFRSKPRVAASKAQPKQQQQQQSGAYSINRGKTAAGRSPTAAATAAAPTSTPSSRGGATDSNTALLVSRFQRGVKGINGISPPSSYRGGTTSGISDCEDDEGSGDALVGGGRACITTTGSLPGQQGRYRLTTERQQLRGPLQGQLKALMDEASAIRSSKEDEIHLLTEEVRVLNEKIWQLRFTMEATSAEKSGASSTTIKRSSSQQKNDKQAKRLEAMVEERRSTVDKLQCLLQSN